jgi:hypothetical protein
VILVVIWLTSLIAGWALGGIGYLLWLLLVVAIILAVFNLLTGRRTL